MIDYNNGKWHDWNGGECPVHPKSVVEVVRGSGAEVDIVVWPAGDFKPRDWTKMGLSSNIRVFRVVTPYAEHQKTKPVTPSLPDEHVRLSDGTIWDMTAEQQYPFGMLTAEQKTALKAHGGPWQEFNAVGWVRATPKIWHGSCIYRVTPEPKCKTITQTMWRNKHGKLWDCFFEGYIPVTVTHEIVDGVPDYSTYHVVAK